MFFKRIQKTASRTTRRGLVSIKRDVRLLLEMLEDRRLLSGTPAEASGYGNLPLAFEANHGQVATQVDFIARGNGYMLSLTPSEAVLNLRNGAGGNVLVLHTSGGEVIQDAPVIYQEEL